MNARLLGISSFVLWYLRFWDSALKSEYLPRRILEKLMIISFGRLKKGKSRRVFPWFSDSLLKKISFLFLNCFPLRKLAPLILNLGFFFDRVIEYSVALKNLGSNHREILLDIGSGYSCFPSYLALKFYSISLDIDRDALIFQKKISKSMQKSFPQMLDCILADCTKLPFRNESANKIFLISTIEHIQSDNVVAMEVGRVLKKAGHCVITLPFSKGAETIQVTPYFERSYTKETIQDRIVTQSSLFIKQLCTFRKALLSLFYKIVPEGWLIFKDLVIGLALFKIEKIFLRDADGELAIIELHKR